MKKKILSKTLAVLFAGALLLSGCTNTGSDNSQNSDAGSVSNADAGPVSGTENPDGSALPENDSSSQPAQSESVKEDELDTENYLKVALNVYYNDSDSNYFTNEAGEPIIITDEGQYTLTFDCKKDLSAEATSSGVISLTNLTAIYLLDMGVAEGKQSPISKCNIMYDSVVVDGNELTITQTEPKSAIKSSGVFDTNDPINSWDGSQVKEFAADDNHVGNFTGLDRPQVISVTFTLSDIVWGEASSEELATAGDNSADAGSYTNTAVFSDIDFTDVDALTFTKYMGNGINLGNTMEAYDRALGTNASVSTYETKWGQPVTTAEMIRGMKDCGFDSLRVPVAWTNMMDWENGDYTINEAYLDRVEEIVNYALDAEMFVIINDHWDGGWWAKFGSSNETSAAEAFEMYDAMWSQIADRFKDYGDMLIFEAANEELGDGLNDNSDWPDSGKLTMDQRYSLTNEINQYFVDLIRKSGGNNDDRFLLVAGYNTDFTMTCDKRFEMPTDSAKNKLLLSVHYYTPWNYCGSEKNARWGIKKDYKEMNGLFAKLTKFTDAGYGIIIGEYAALPYWENGKPNLKDNTLEFTKNVLDNCDIYGYVPMLWSCNDLYLKGTKTMASPELNALFTSRCYAEETAAGDGYLTSVKESMDKAAKDALDIWDDVKVVEDGTPMAWIMWNGGAGTYSVGDTYNPADNTMGIKATDVEVTGAGDYTVSLDFEGGNTGLTFAALGLAYGETLYPGCIINIKEILLDGEKVTLSSLPYTSSDDGVCTRVNLYNEWVKDIPEDARNIAGNLKMSTPTPLDKTLLTDVKNITINFELVLKN
ncbi:MAG: glycoside hydrolase family 5 protein [Lachnospiraceae bacterium]|nr:glycoside hydrolase family 5 protein [Lachnospiraceae bacterium]